MPPGWGTAGLYGVRLGCGNSGYPVTSNITEYQLFDYLTNFIHIMYGKQEAYGVVSSTKSAKAAEVASRNALYNEYMWYRLFVSYYSYSLYIESDYSDISNNRTKALESNMEKVY